MSQPHLNRRRAAQLLVALISFIVGFTLALPYTQAGGCWPVVVIALCILFFALALRLRQLRSQR